MKFSLERPVKIVMLGAGGTGGYAAPHIYTTTLSKTTEGSISTKLRELAIRTFISGKKPEILPTGFACFGIQQAQRCI